MYDAKPETTDGKLIKFLRDEFPKESIVRIPRRHYCDSTGSEIIRKYCSDKYNFVKELVAAKYYALTAVAALFKYLQYVHNIFFKENSLKLECETKFAHMQIGQLFFFLRKGRLNYRNEFARCMLFVFLILSYKLTLLDLPLFTRYRHDLQIGAAYTEMPEHGPIKFSVVVRCA